MKSYQYEDGMLLRKAVALRDGIRTEGLNPLWVEHMLQQLVEGNHDADLLLRPVFATLKKPKLSGIAKLLERRKPPERQRGFEPEIKKFITEMNWSGGPDEVDLTLATMKNLFLDPQEGRGETEGKILDAAQSLGLRPCPDWVVPALILHTEEEDIPILQRPSINFCLAKDAERDTALAAWVGSSWWVYGRRRNLDISWSSNMNWLFVKPRFKLV